MPLILRKIEKGRWRTGPDLEDLPWLPAGEVQAQALLDLVPKDNRLSVWQLTDDRSNLDRILAALASARDGLFNVDFAILDQRVLSDLSLPIEQVPGDSADEAANRTWHHDLVHLTVSRIADLSHAILERSERLRCQDKAVGRLVLNAIDAGWIDPTRLREGLLSRLDRLRLPRS